MQDARTRGALIALALVIGGGSGAALWATRRPAPPPVVITPAPAPSPRAPRDPLPSSGEGGRGTRPGEGTPPALGAGGPTPHRPASPLYVHVAGAVKRPSLYALPAGSRVMQAVHAAGGPAPGADLDSVNLAERVRDGEKVYIPRRQPQAAPPTPMAAPPGNTLGHADAPPPSAPTAPPGAVAPGSGAGGRTSGGDKLRSPSQGHVALNTADAAQLQRLPGVGPAMAARILAYRQQAHGFRAIDDLQNVTGIGPKKFAKIAPLVTLD